MARWHEGAMDRFRPEPLRTRRRPRSGRQRSASGTEMKCRTTANWAPHLRAVSRLHLGGYAAPPGPQPAESKNLCNLRNLRINFREIDAGPHHLRHRARAHGGATASAPSASAPTRSGAGGRARRPQPDAVEAGRVGAAPARIGPARGLASTTARHPGARPHRAARRVLARCGPYQRMARRGGRKLGARALLSRRPGAARLPAGGPGAHRQGAALRRVDPDDTRPTPAGSARKATPTGGRTW